MHYKLATAGPIKWTENQERTISLSSTIFHPSQPSASLDERVRLTYLQFLCLPEVLFPLRHLTRMLLSLVESDDAAALHLPLDSISLTNRWCSYKYQEHVPKVLAQRLSGELEDQMILFAIDHRAESESMDGSDEDTSRKWLEQMEKREVRIQILIHLLRLTLPGPCPPPTNRPIPAPPRKRRRLQHTSSSDTEEATPEHILEDRLESLMDRLVLWQMALPATDAEQDAFDAEGTQQQAAVGRELRDWTQEFCEDVVQPLFATKLPHLYRLLRVKLFRIPQWSEDDDEQPNDPPPKTSRPASRARDPADDSTQRTSGSRAPSRSRSRSLSVSLSQDAEQLQRNTSRKRVLQREVSMSKVFKDKPRRAERTFVAPRVAQERKMKAAGTVLVAGTPQKARARAGGPVVLVAGTPMKARAIMHRGAGPRDGQGGDGGGGGGDSSDGESLFAS